MIALARPVMLYHRIEIDEATAGSGITAGSVFGLGLPLVVSNAAGVSLGGVIADADVTVTMAEGGVADNFTIVLYDLPLWAAGALKGKVGKPDQPGLSVTVRLGYLDTPTTLYSVKPVLRGRVTEVTESSTDAGRSTLTVSGEEEVGYVLRTTRAAAKVVDSKSADDLVKDLVDAARTQATTLKIAPEAIKVVEGSKLGTTLTNYTVRSYSVLAVLADLAYTANQALVVDSSGVAFGSAVGGGASPVTFEAQTNTVTFSSSTKEKSTSASDTGSGGGTSPGSSSDGGGLGSSLAAAAGLSPSGDKDASATVTVTALGDPELRVGRSVQVSDGNPTSPWKGVALRIQQLKHVYDTTKGFTTEVTATAAKNGSPAANFTGARGVVDQWNKQLDKNRAGNPSVDVGQAAAYVAGKDATAKEAGHRVSLHYGPKTKDSPDKSAGAPAAAADKSASHSPSTDDQITDDGRSDLLKRPIASVFAFDNVGLVTPVYQGMRAVLVHNGQQTNDAIVAGWLWPTDPKSPTPPNEVGDYWLALPTGMDGNGRPTGKGVNDLVDAAGHRVITAVSTRIVVGQAALDDVGTRPKVADADTLVIEHSSGTKVTIDKDGGITISSEGEVQVTTKGKGLTFGNGSVSLKIDGSSVQVGP